MNCIRRKMLTVFVGIVSQAAPLQAETKVDWDAEKTWVFAVGLLEWQHPDLWSAFPEAKKNRRDKQLVEHFREAGVPGDQIKYLRDAEATKRRIETDFIKLLDETDDGDLLVFYFCGHGYRDSETGQTSFANYDAGKKDSSAWNVRSIFTTIENHFSGNRVLMLADCCHSGALYDQAQKQRDSKIAYAVLTSSYAHNLSTGNWTFSDSVLAGLRGEVLVDLDGDEMVTLQEEFAPINLRNSLKGTRFRFNGTRISSGILRPCSKRGTDCTSFATTATTHPRTSGLGPARFGYVPSSWLSDGRRELGFLLKTAYGLCRMAFQGRPGPDSRNRRRPWKAILLSY